MLRGHLVILVIRELLQRKTDVVVADFDARMNERCQCDAAKSGCEI